jgi:hypothetical protein
MAFTSAEPRHPRHAGGRGADGCHVSATGHRGKARGEGAKVRSSRHTHPMWICPRCTAREHCPTTPPHRVVSTSALQFTPSTSSSSPLHKHPSSLSSSPSSSILRPALVNPGLVFLSSHARPDRAPSHQPHPALNPRRHNVRPFPTPLTPGRPSPMTRTSPLGPAALAPAPPLVATPRTRR